MESPNAVAEAPEGAAQPEAPVPQAQVQAQATPKLSPEQEELKARNEREQRCVEEVNAVLAKYDCELTVGHSIKVTANKVG